MEAVSRALGGFPTARSTAHPRRCSGLGFQVPPPRLPAVAQQQVPSWLLAHRASGSLRLSCSSSAAPKFWVVSPRLLQTRVLWPWLPTGWQQGGGSCGLTAPLHTSVMALLGAAWENDFNPSRQKQISYISSVHKDQAEVKRLLFFPRLDSKRG